MKDSTAILAIAGATLAGLFLFPKETEKVLGGGGGGFNLDLSGLTDSGKYFSDTAKSGGTTINNYLNTVKDTVNETAGSLAIPSGGTGGSSPSQFFPSLPGSLTPSSWKEKIVGGISSFGSDVGETIGGSITGFAIMGTKGLFQGAWDVGKTTGAATFPESLRGILAPSSTGRQGITQISKTPVLSSLIKIFKPKKSFGFSGEW